MWWAIDGVPSSVETQTAGAGAGQMVSHPALTGTGAWPPGCLTPRRRCVDPPAPLGAPFRARDDRRESAATSTQLGRGSAAREEENVSAAVLVASCAIPVGDGGAQEWSTTVDGKGARTKMEAISQR